MIKRSVHLKSMIRSPLRTALFLLLIALVNFAFLSQVFEGLIVNREINRLSEQYKAIGTLMPMEPWEWGVTEVIDLLEESPLVASTESLRLIPGVMSDIYTPDFDRRSPFPNRMFVYGTLVSKRKVNMVCEEIPEEIILAWRPMNPYLQLYYFDIYVDDIMASLPEYVSVGRTLRFFLIDYNDHLKHVYQQAEIGQRYFVHGQYSKNMRGLWAFGEEVLQFPTNNEPENAPFPRGSDLPYAFDMFDLMLQPLNSDGVFLYPISETDEIDNSEILEQVSKLRENIHTIFLRPTRDMSARSEVATSMFLSEGRFLDAFDYENANLVAVIRTEFATHRNLELGDTLTITMREEPFATEYIMPRAARFFPTPLAGERMNFWRFVKERHDGDMDRAAGNTQAVFRFYEGAFPANRFFQVLTTDRDEWTTTGIGRTAFPSPFLDGIAYGNWLFVDGRGVDEIMNLEMATGYISDNDYDWRERETYEVTLEVVGIYGTLDRLSNLVTLSHNNVYVPNSVVPSHWKQEGLYRNFSFVLHSPADEEEFAITYQGILEEKGFWPFFVENDWNDFVVATTPIQSGIIIRVLAFGLLIFVVYYLVVLLHFSRSVKEFAISRALGLKKVWAIWSTMLPMYLKGVLGIVIGGIPAWYFAISRAKINLARLEGAVFSTPSVYWIGVMFGLLFLFILIICANEARRLASYSELELLQGGAGAKRIKEKRKKETKVYRDKFRGINIIPEVTIIENGKICKEFVREKVEESDLEQRSISENIDWSTLLKVSKPKKSKMIILCITRMITRFILRKPAKSTISISVALGFVFILSLIPVFMMNNQRQIEYLYDNNEVTGTIIIDPQTGMSRQGSIHHLLLQEILELAPYENGGEVAYREVSGEVDLRIERNEKYFVGKYYAEARHPVAIEVIREAGQGTRMREPYIIWTNLFGFNNLYSVEEFHEVDFAIVYRDGFDSNLFADVNFGNPVVLISNDLREEMEVNFGDEILLAPFTGERIIPHEQMTRIYQIVGFFEGTGGFPPLITSLETLQDHVGNTLRYDRLEFELNTYFNRELDLFEQGIETLLEGREPRFVFILRDHVLRGVVEPLEQNIVMMETLYPIIFGLTGIIAMGLTILLLLPSIKIATMMRALGTSKLGVATVLGLEQVVLCVIGLILGMMVSMLTFGWVNIQGVILYLGGCMFAVFFLNVVLVNKKTLALLQVKE